MNIKNDGGPAFPLNSHVIEDLASMGRDEELTVGDVLHHPGMTLRDWFAGLAMQGMLSSNHNIPGSTEQNIDAIVAAEAYRTADFMLIEREN